MKFYSTNKSTEPVSFKEAVYQSLPPDNGLYFPEYIPDLTDIPFRGLSLPEIGYEILKPFSENDIPDQTLLEIIYDTLRFDIPLVNVEENIHSLELFHGPTYAFKDVGARFLARCLSFFNQQENNEVTILVATSGDTGGAVAAGFHNIPGVNVIILYPSGGVSDLQEKQLTTLGGNIKALEIDGTFDDCQSLVKHAFLDKQLRETINISSANSINIARWIPQSIYYFWALNQLKENANVVFSVSSGNYGNLAAGLLAKKMGLNIGRFIASSNLNNVVPRYLDSGVYEPRPTIQTYSNAMDVGKPSNYPRMMELYENSYKQIITDITGGYLNDETTLKTMSVCWEQNNYVLDPHGAIGYQILKDNLKENEVGVFLATAHPCKFLPIIQKVISDYQIPDFAKDLINKSKKSTKISGDYQTFKEFLTD